jgi:ankyrin repeat protein
VKLLLERKEVTPDSPDKDCKTPLWWAAQNGRIVKLLLERKEAASDSPPNGGQAPLSLAAKNGHLGAVRLILEQPIPNPNTLIPCSEKAHSLDPSLSNNILATGTVTDSSNEVSLKRKLPTLEHGSMGPLDIPEVKRPRYDDEYNSR